MVKYTGKPIKINQLKIQKAYGLMAYISGQIAFGSRLDHFKIVKWLVSQRNPHGGFGSTQVSKALASL